MHVEELHADAAPTVLFLHGGNVAGWMWADQVAALSGHHCLVPDLPGFGRSADLDWTTLAEVADQLHHVCSVEDPELFNAVLRQWLIEGRSHARLLPYRK